MLTSSVVLLVVASIYTVHARSNGAPSSACNNLTPNAASHGASPQNNPSPYNIDLTPFSDGNGGYEYVPGQTYTLTISGNNGETFRGFFVQCRLVADDNTRVGVFAAPDDNTRLSSCPIDTDGVTHVNSDTPRIEFTSRTMEWTAPAVDTGPVRFGFAVVEVQNTYWANQRTDVIPEFVGSGDPPSPNTPPDTPTTESAAGVFISLLSLLSTTLAALLL